MEATLREISQLRERVDSLPPEAAAEIARLKDQISELEGRLNRNRSAWDHVQLSRHEGRPYTLDYISRIFEGFRQIHGDRKYADDPSIVGGSARLDGRQVMVIGHQKGRNTKDRIYRNYGMPRPEGYRKAIRLMELSARFRRPILTFIDTPGAYPGIGAEERGQAEAIAFNLKKMARLPVPIIVTVLGEGGSGGALAIGVGDRVLMLEHSIYSVISPESCSAILWKDQQHARQAAENLRLTAEHLLKLGVIEEIVPEPAGGAQNSWDEAAELLKERLLYHLGQLEGQPVEELLQKRFEKFRSIGFFSDAG